MTKLTDEQIKLFQELFTIEDLEEFLYSKKCMGALESRENAAVKLSDFLNRIKR